METAGEWDSRGTDRAGVIGKRFLRGTEIMGAGRTEAAARLHLPMLGPAWPAG